MPKLTLVLILAVLLAAFPGPAGAQAPSQGAPGATQQQADVIAFATEYTQSVMVGVLTGGLLMNLLVGGGGPTLAGALAGSTLASWLFVDGEARHYVIRRTGPLSK